MSVSLAIALNIFFNLTGIINLSQNFVEDSNRQFDVSLSFGIIAYGVVVPIIEELLFRKLIFGLLQRFLAPMAGIVISSLLFAVYHGNPIQGVYAFIMGMVFCYVYYLTGKIRTTFLMHGLANASVFLLFSNEVLNGAVSTPINCGIFFIVALGCMYRIKKQTVLK